MPFAKFMLGSLLGGWFDPLLSAFFGQAFRDLTEFLSGSRELGPLDYTIYALQITFGISMTIFITIYVRREMKKFNKEEEEEEEEGGSGELEMSTIDEELGEEEEEEGGSDKMKKKEGEWAPNQP